MLISFVFLLAAIPAAHADPDSDGLAAFGLLGTWAFDCKHPPSGTDFYETYAAHEGSAPTLHFTAGGNPADFESPVSGVHINTPTQLALSYTIKGKSFDVLIEKSSTGTKIRTLQAVSRGGELVIEGGYNLKAHADSPALQQCQ